MAQQIQLRRDTAANWTSANPTLAQGEIGYETNTGFMKIGDGSTAWNSLGYFIRGGMTFTGDVSVPDEAYSSDWNGDLSVPTKNAVYDKIETVSAGSGTGISWSEITGTSQAASVNSGYVTNNASRVTITLPDTAAVGSIIKVVGKGSGGWKIAQNAAEQIIWDEGGVDGTNETTVGTGGYIESTDDYNCVELVCITANTTWLVVSSKGDITIA